MPADFRHTDGEERSAKNGQINVEVEIVVYIFLRVVLFLNRIPKEIF